tara:strand:+ start:72 stop:389 length:318 start_codon:yes stop_codon:yes gene_type:complete
MKKIILFLLFFSVSLNAASLKIINVKQKTLSNGRAYGLEGGIYFEVKDAEPLIMYKIQYSKDLKNWTDLVQVTTWYNSITSPYYTWDKLPKDKCFFRIIRGYVSP